MDIVGTFIDTVLFAVCIFILAGCLFLSFRLRFVQLRLLPNLFKLLISSIFSKNSDDQAHTVKPHKALFAAMSTTLGISTIVAPVIAMRLGGPGAMLGFLLTSFFGAAATYAEVNLSIRYRQMTDKGVMGGPMQYLSRIFSPAVGKWYAISCLVLMTAWSGAQANQLSAVFDSPLLGDYRVPVSVSGVVIALLTMLVLIGGIKRIGSFSSKLVPTMFLLYLGSCLWILGHNLDKIGPAIFQMFQSAFSPYSMASGIAVGGVVSALRWGVFKGLQTNEAGIGTQTIPHSMAETDNASSQASLAMLSTYTAGFIAFLSGIVVLITGTWQDENLPLGISMMAASFEMYFSYFGIFIVAFSTLLFGFGTILGNSYNGSQCFRYLTGNRRTRYYYIAMAIMIFMGSIAEVKTVWSVIDLFLAGMAIPHMAALIMAALKQRESILNSEFNA